MIEHKKKIQQRVKEEKKIVKEISKNKEPETDKFTDFDYFYYSDINEIPKEKE